MKDLAIVILNFNGKEHLRQFLPSVIMHSEGARIIVADNASTDDSVAFLKDAYPSVEIIQLEENLGYSGGYDHVLKQISAEFFCLLNSDVEVTSGWLEPVLQIFAENESIAAVQPKILSYSQKNTFEYAGAGGGFIDQYGFPFCRGRIFESYEKDEGQYDDSREIFWASGACLFIRSSDFLSSGGLDEDFFAHMEEIDLCWRLWGMGKKVYYQGASTVYHVGGGTLSKSNPKKTYLNFKNGLSLLYKNYTADLLIRTMIIRVLFDFVAIWRFIFILQWRHAGSVIRAHADFWSQMSLNRKKRSESQSLMRISETQVIYKGSVVLQYFVGRRRNFRQLKSIKGF
ncbi:glycosyltransferase family 2 protein [Fulvivirga sedimenti]|uniref:Glycosyltransferase family 2 protein n=1 Tax=Fulvivirga sedimenti TaxID=2879465 RepID=A0A9X1L153_9BACT|nr:glycosyltransferase family 2 protein [Fulvivirga sedimenti]MCA6075384.1 glycosyltransferase family 2 protein [Fulvivirga sedimenti]MCA6076561.1 glycosyltransferase family 2 protein [Fulvivirga sedimenti]MCA6077689.1 glycosyltransferase family 2 protein [Fulvivirga sedimenti]